MIYERLDSAIEYVAQKNGLSKREVEIAFLTQFKFLRYVMSTVDIDKEYFPTVFYSGFITMGFSKKKWDKMKDRIFNKRKNESLRHTE